MIEAALHEFGQHGYDGTSTAVIARRAGIKQPYIYALFADKAELFLACFDSLQERMLARFSRAAGEHEDPSDRLQAMGDAYMELLIEDPAMLCHLQIFAAAGHAELRAPIQSGVLETIREIGRLSAAGDAAIARFYATGLFLTSMTSLELTELFAAPLHLVREDQIKPLEPG